MELGWGAQAVFLNIFVPDRLSPENRRYPHDVDGFPGAGSETLCSDDHKATLVWGNAPYPAQRREVIARAAGDKGAGA